MDPNDNDLFICCLKKLFWLGYILIRIEPQH